MILGVNGIRLVRDLSGVARAIEAILNTMAEVDHPFTEVRVYSPEPLDGRVRLPAGATSVVARSPLPPGLWEQLVLPVIHGTRYPLLCPSYVAPMLASCPTLVIHHGSYEGYDDAAESLSWWTRTKARVSYPMSARRATVVTTVSEYSRRDMSRFYGLPADRIHVVPEGVDTRLFRPIPDERVRRDFRMRTLGEDVPFILYVGKPTKRRNLPNLLAAFASLKRERHLAHKLLLVGTSLPGIALAPLIEEHGLTSEVVTLGHAAHAELVLAYSACAAFVYPSSYEGFGMPVLEAMACGAPVITLNNTAFPEFAGGVATLLPDASVTTLAGALADLLGNEARRRTMADAGPRRAAAYDWRIITARYMELLSALAQN